ncbi:MAG: substrate-binding domain-containing protein [Candidatus Velthaea sp.]
MNVTRTIGRVAALSLLVTSTAANVPALAQDKAPVNVGIVYSKTGLLGNYGAQYIDGFHVGLEYATHGTGMVAGHKIVVTERDDAGDPAKAVATAKELIGQNYRILAGSTASGVALQLAPVANENKVLYISGAAATDAITGNNRYTFRSGRQTYQDVAAAAAIIGNMRGKKILVFAQDSAFGQANFKAVSAVLGGAGASVSSVLVPLSASDFSPFAQKVKDAKPDLVFVAWAGATAGAMWKGLEDAGVPSSLKISTGLDDRSSYGNFASTASKITFFSHYFAGASKSKVNQYLVAAEKKEGKTADLFSADGFVAAQMIVHAIEKADGDDVNKMLGALEGWSFEAPKGRQTVRAADHAMLQPMFVAKLEGSGATLEARPIKTLDQLWVAPRPQSFK